MLEISLYDGTIDHLELKFNYLFAYIFIFLSNNSNLTNDFLLDLEKKRNSILFIQLIVKMPSRRGSSSSDEDFELVELDSESQKHAAKVAKSSKELEALTISTDTSNETDGKLSQSELEHELELSRKQVAELREENSQIRRQLEDLLTKADGRNHVEQV